MSRRFLRVCLLGLSITFLIQTAFAQTDALQSEANYDAVLQIIAAADSGTTGQALPPNLQQIAKQLKTNFPVTELRIVNTYVGRIANGGNFEYKSVSNVFGQSQDSETPSFWDWSLFGLKSGAGRSDILLQAFRFGARIPVRTTNLAGPADRPQTVFNYESIGLSSQRLSLREGTPTLLGSLALPKTSGAVFLVLTLRSA